MNARDVIAVAIHAEARLWETDLLAALGEAG